MNDWIESVGKWCIDEENLRVIVAIILFVVISLPAWNKRSSKLEKRRDNLLR